MGFGQMEIKVPLIITTSDIKLCSDFIIDRRKVPMGTIASTSSSFEVRAAYYPDLKSEK